MLTPFMPLILGILVVSLAIATPFTLRIWRSDKPALSAIIPGTVALSVTLLAYIGLTVTSLFMAQEIKAAQIVKDRAGAVEYRIQLQQAHNFYVDGTVRNDDLADIALGETSVLQNNANALSNGETVTFKSASGKTVTVQLAPSDRNGDKGFYKAVVTLDGKPFSIGDHLLGEYGRVPKDSSDSWANNFPLLELKSVSNPSKYV
jgi:hypothetical protein